jgi:Skp family chaperone for outer membrane proteins
MNQMPIKTLLRCSVLAVATVLAACASAPAENTAPAAPAAPAAASAPALAPSEAEAATQLEKKFQDAARSYKVVQKDGKTMYCKKEKVIGSTIPTMQCLSEAQLRLQVEQMDQMRDRMRNSGGRCTNGAGCGAGS